MCGIGGFLSLTPQVHIPEQWLKALSAQQKHRGPDADTRYLNPERTLGLCHQRLAILDLSEDGNQPMHYLNYSLIFNGEIYNYLALKQELQGLGHTFKTQTDSEVLLVAYAEWGERCIEKLNGMWAFVIWDHAQSILFCSRDRFGIKPFYYTTQQQVFAFASEINALSHWHTSELNLNPEAIGNYLWHGLYDVGESTFYQEILQLPPAHNLVIEQKTGALRTYPYWSLTAPTTPEPISAERFRALLEDSVKLQLQSDVPVGTCLSGGLDSSTITALIHHIQAQRADAPTPSTFSACFEDKRFDERQYIQQIIQATQAQEHFVFPDPATLQQDLEALIRHQGEPFGSLSIFAQWCVMRKAHEQGIKVLLDGQGADELLAGYGYDNLLWRDLFFQRQWRSLFTEFAAALQHGPVHCAKKIASACGLARSNSFSAIQKVLTMTPPPPPTTPRRSPLGFLRHQLHNLLNIRLPALLRHEDRNAMAFGIEARVPFLDHRLAEFLWKQPLQALIYRGWSKWLLRSAMQDILPAPICWRKDKMGFVTPQTMWSQNELVPLYQSIIASPSFRSRPWWQANRVDELYAAFLKEPSDEIAHFLWRLINLELWLRQAKTR